MEEAVTIERGPVTLEARLGRMPSPAGGVALCHPHPLYGGDLDNPVVVRVAEVCRASSLTTLRFNFRGVGRSTGVHAAGEDELEDVRGALGIPTAREGNSRRWQPASATPGVP